MSSLPPSKSKKRNTEAVARTNANRPAGATSARTKKPRIVDPSVAGFLRLRRRANRRLPQLGESFTGTIVEYEFVSDEALRNITEEQAGRVIRLLEGRPRAGNEVYRGLNDNAVLGPDETPVCVVWLSSRCFLRRGGGSYPNRVDGRMVKLQCRYDYSDGRGRQVDFFDMDRLPTHRPAPPPVEEGDAMLRILGRHSAIHEFELTFRITEYSVHVSAAALQEFVGTIPRNRHPSPYWRNHPGNCCQSTMRVKVDGFRLSEAHKRVLAYGCHPELHLTTNVHSWETGSGVDMLVDAIQTQRGPVRLTLHEWYGSPDYNHVRAVVEALEFDSRVDVLDLDFPESSRHRDIESLDLNETLVRMMSHNRGLQSLRIVQTMDLLQMSWSSFWRGVASHPMLKVLDLPRVRLSNYTESQLEEMAQLLRSSTSLQYLLLSPEEPIDQIPILRDKVLPFLLLNRYRPTFEAILTDPDRNRRRTAFWSALVDDDDVRNTPALIFHLITEGSDLFVQNLSTRVDGHGAEV